MKLQDSAQCPPDPAPTVLDDVNAAADVLEAAGIPDYLASIIAIEACAGWPEANAVDFMHRIRVAVRSTLECA